MVLDFGWATISLAFILHPQLFSLEFVSSICTLGLAMVGLAFLFSALNGSKHDIDLSICLILTLKIASICPYGS